MLEPQNGFARPVARDRPPERPGRVDIALGEAVIEACVTRISRSKDASRTVEIDELAIENPVPAAIAYAAVETGIE